MATETIKAQALTRALTLLRSVGASFVVIDAGEGGEGTKYESDDMKGWLLLPPSPPQPEKKPRKPRVQRWDFSQMTGYVDKLVNAQPGDLLTWTRAEWPEMAGKECWANFRASVCSMARRKYGPGNYLVEQNDKVLTILREA